ncbi:MAG: TetR/AcrR family transcriptional regulator [Actinomycetota bacterium]
MAPRDAEATRRRILDAALAEFATHGLAGARVDRIAVTAKANKQLIYAYYGNKDQLFDTVVEHAFQHAHDAVPFTPDDLVSYAATLFDYLVEHPDHLRIHEWRRLERPGATELERQLFNEKVDDLAEVQPNYGKNGRFSPADVMVIVVALASAWALAPAALRDLATHDPKQQRSLIAGSIHVLTHYRQDSDTAR